MNVLCPKNWGGKGITPLENVKESALVVIPLCLHQMNVNSRVFLFCICESSMDSTASMSIKLLLGFTRYNCKGKRILL